MKSTGIVRGIDALGRIVLPKELRTSMKLETDAKLEIFVDGDAIVLKKYRPKEAATSAGPSMEQGRAVRRLLHLLRLPEEDRCPLSTGRKNEKTL